VTALVETLPVRKFHGVGPATARKMARLGIETGLDHAGKAINEALNPPKAAPRKKSAPR
jgi:nucleotidyltransferase/DNA polymerase involved in DNA repair